MNVFVDTSALYALLDQNDDAHDPARAWLEGVVDDASIELVMHGYVVVECSALVHRRLGTEFVRRLLGDLVPGIIVSYVDEGLHLEALAAYLATLSRQTSLVDHVSFAFMRREAISHAFAFDEDFTEAGFELVA